MGWLILLIISIIYGCAPLSSKDLYRKTSNDAVTKQCDLPVLFGIDKSVPEELEHLILNSIEYWDNLYKKDLFFYMDGDFDEDVINSQAMVVFKVVARNTKGLDKAAASTYIGKIYSKDGCMPNPVIKIREDILIYSDAAIETVVRHEIGHVLGFEDSYELDDLMFIKVNMLAIDKVKGLSEREMKAFELNYK